MNFYKYILLFSLLLGVGVANGQKAWMEPSGDDFNPSDKVTIYIDISKCECQKLVGEEGPLFLWTWMPSGPDGELDDDKDPNTTDDRTPIGGNGQWTSSNPLLELTKEEDLGPDVWSFTMIPTVFYGVSESEVYNNDFSFLAKAKDGGAGGTCEDEFKTEDLGIEVDPPGLPKVMTIPVGVSEGDTTVLASTADEIMTIRYDHLQEENDNLIDESEFYVYLRARGDDGVEYKVAQSLAVVDETEELRMKEQDNDVFTLSFFPNNFFKDVPDGVNIVFVRYQIVKKGFATTADIVSLGNKNEFRYTFNCN